MFPRHRFKDKWVEIIRFGGFRAYFENVSFNLGEEWMIYFEESISS